MSIHFPDRMKLIFLFFTLIAFTAPHFAQSDFDLELQDAKSLISSERYGEAIELLNRFITAHPESYKALFLRATAHEKRGNYEQAVYDYKTALKLSPDNKEIADNLANAENDWYRLLYNRIEGYKREIAINPSNPLNYLEIGKCYKSLGEWNEAEIWYDIFLEKEFASADEMLRYTEILAKNNHIKKGESYLKTYVEKFPDDHRLWSRYGYFLYWLGKKNLSENAFLRALKIRPYFKEALDGYDLVKGKRRIYSINDTTYKYSSLQTGKVYLIDEYFRQLKYDPDNFKLRFKLIEELLKFNRIEEAYQQLELIRDKQSGDTRFKELYATVNEKRNKLIDEQISSLSDEIYSGIIKKESLTKLCELLVYRNRIDDAIELLNNYLENSEDSDIRLLLAEYLLWKGDLCSSKTNLEFLLSNNFDNSKAELMLAKIYLWLNQNLDKAEYLFEKVLSGNPQNNEAIEGFLQCQIQLNKFSEFEINFQEFSRLLSEDQKSKLQSEFESKRKNKETEENFALLEKAREFVQKKDFDAAIDLFEILLKKFPDNSQIKLELADAYSATNQFHKSEKLYDQILSEKYDYEIDKIKVKNIFWNKNYSLASKELRRLNLKNPKDIEIQLMLADAYLFDGSQDKAREIYYRLLEKAPDSFILNQRLVWLGDKVSPGYNFNVQILPSGYFFTDNIDFSLSTQSMGIKTTIVKNLAVGGTIHRGVLSSVSEDRTFITAEGTLNLYLFNRLRLDASFGRIFFSDDQKQIKILAGLNFEKLNNYSFNLNYQKSDAAIVLFSPNLVFSRLETDVIDFSSIIYPGYNFILSARYLFLAPQNNKGHQLTFKVGNKIFDPLKIGYELFYYTFDEQTDLYWSPKDFSSHSLWFDWKILKSNLLELNLGAKGGLIAKSNFILSEVYSDFKINILKNLIFNLHLAGSSTYRNSTGNYRSFSIFSGIQMTF